MNAPSVLVIDDEPNNFDVIETFLSQEDYQIYYAPGGAEALTLLETFTPDVILLDVMMPGIDGIQVCQTIKSAIKGFIPIIMVTALNAKEDLARCLNAGADDFISKPVNSLELRARLRASIRSKQQYDRIESFSELQRDTINILSNNLKELTDNIAMSFPHELNTPLNGIIGIIDLLNCNFETMNPKLVRQMLALLDSSARRLENLTKKFLTYLELEISNHDRSLGKKELVVYDVAEIKDALVNLAEQYDREKDLIVYIEEAKIALSQKYLTIMLVELVDNALKCSPKNTGVTVKALADKEKVSISVKDSGWGIKEEQIAAIDSFRQFDRHLHEQQGLGLGLKIVKKIVALAGGKLYIKSVYGQETTVNIFLPLVER